MARMNTNKKNRRESSDGVEAGKLIQPRFPIRVHSWPTLYSRPVLTRQNWRIVVNLFGMYEDPDSEPSEHASTPKEQAAEHADRFRMHAELAAVFEGPRKFDAAVDAHLDADAAREIQRTIGKLEKSRETDSPLIPEPSVVDARTILSWPVTHSLTTSDYHIHRRPGEVMIVRWLSGDEVDTFYDRLQAHFDAALNAFRGDERSSKEWKQDPDTLAYLEALQKIDIKMADRYLQKVVDEHRVFLMTTQTADEMNIAYLTETVMGVPAAEVVGKKSAPPSEPSDSDLAWFFKLFSLRGIVENVPRMCFFTYLQKTDDSYDF